MRPAVTLGSAVVTAVLLAQSAASPLDAGDAPLPVTALLSVSVVPMDRGVVLRNQTVLVEGDRIVAVGRRRSVALPPRARRINATGMYLVPGLVDMHVHVRERDLAAYVANGVTSVRNMWGYSTLPEIMERVEGGDLVGPTIYSASPGLDGTPPSWPETQIVEDPRQADAVVAQQIADGWRFIKVYQNLRPAVYDGILDAARARGIRVVGHVPTDVAVEHALEAGQASIEHLRGYDLALTRRPSRPADLDTWVDIDASRLPELAEATRLAGTWNCPTLAIWEVFTRDMASADRERVLANRAMVTAALHVATGRILVGTDSGIDQTAAGTSIHDELEDLVTAGLSRYEALRGATYGAAVFLGETDEIGSVTVGRRADLLLLSGNPLADLRVLRSPRGILWHGRWRLDPGSHPRPS